MKKNIKTKVILLLVVVIVSGCGGKGADADNIYKTLHNNMESSKLTIEDSATEIMGEVTKIFLNDNALLPMARASYSNDLYAEHALNNIDNYTIRGHYFESMLNTYGVSSFALIDFVEEAMGDDYDGTRDELEELASEMNLIHSKDSRLSASQNEVELELELDEDYLPEMESTDEYNITDYSRKYDGVVKLKDVEKQRSIYDIEDYLSKIGYDYEKYGEPDIEYIQSLLNEQNQLSVDEYIYVDVYKLMISCEVNGVETTRYFIQSVEYTIGICDDRLYDLEISTVNYKSSDFGYGEEVSKDEYENAYKFVKDYYSESDYYSEYYEER